MIDKLNTILPAPQDHVVPNINLDRCWRDNGILQADLNALIATVQDSVILDQQGSIHVVQPNRVVCCAKINIAAIETSTSGLVGHEVHG